MLKKISIVGAVLLVIGIIGGAVTFKSVLKAESNTKEEIIAEKFTEIDIHAEDIAVNVETTDDSETTIKMKTQTNEHELTTNVSDDILNVNVNHIQKKLFNFDFFDFTPNIYVYVPEKDYEKVAIKTDNGVITITDMTSEKVTATSYNGLIKLKNITAKDVKTLTENGLITLDNIEGNITSKTTNGKIDLLAANLDKMVNLQTTNGIIKIITEKEPKNTTIDANVENGRLKVFGKSQTQSIIGDGENEVSLTTENGMITVE